jgi:hypothetical protein
VPARTKFIVLLRSNLLLLKGTEEKSPVLQFDAPTTPVVSDTLRRWMPAFLAETGSISG